jgi:hydrogenase expression/formation protein HypD
MGADEWRFVPERHGLPVAVAGFGAESVLAAIHHIVQQRQAGVAQIDNAYPEVVTACGNQRAQALLREAFDIRDANWRGIGTIADSGYFLAQNHAHRCAATRFPVELIERRRTGGMPPGCDCAAVLLAQKAPAQCRLYGTACTPQHPVGPCMVSDEGACRIWWSAGLRE